MTQENLTDEGIEASESLDLDLAQVKAAFTGMNTFLREAPKLGEEIKFTVTAFTRKKGREYIEKDGKSREFVSLSVESIELL